MHMPYHAHAEHVVASQVFHALEAGVLPVYLGAPNVADFVPPHSVVRRADFASAAALASVEAAGAAAGGGAPAAGGTSNCASPTSSPAASPTSATSDCS